jgi:hypothetical protein
MHATRIAVVLAALAAACTSSSPEPQPVTRPASELPDLIVSGSCSRVEDMLRVTIAVVNRGTAAAAPSTLRIDFDVEPLTSLQRRTHFIAAHAVDSFELEMPAGCIESGCRWQASADVANQVTESDEANNSFAGRC